MRNPLAAVRPIRSMASLWRKFCALFVVYVQEGIAYRASGIIWILTDVATAITMPLVWIAATRAQGGDIQGFGANDFVLYYLCMLMVSSFVTSHLMWEISSEIREGFFSTHLLRPVNYLMFSIARNLPWRLVRTVLFLPWYLLFLVLYRHYMEGATVHMSWEFWVALLLGHMVSVLFVSAMALIALYTQEAQSIFELYYVPMLFLSGQMFPIALFPDWARHIALLFPFYYTTGVPTEILVGKLSGVDALQAIGGQLVWIALSLVMFKILWTRGLRQYNGVGL